MKNVSPETLLKINKIVDQLFHSLAVSFLGQIPQLTKDKKISFSTNSNNLAHLFIQALGNTRPNSIEQEIFKQMLTAANGYVDSLKEKTKSQVQNSVSNYYLEKQLRNEAPQPEDLQGIIREHLDKAQNHFKIIANAESNKIRNVGNAIKIKQMSDERGQRAMVFFNPILDDRNDPETYRLHVLPDRVTPRIYYLDEIENKYHKKGDKWPKLAGTNPNCRCALTAYQIGYGFDDSGKLVFKSLDYNELEEQRKKYGMP